MSFDPIANGWRKLLKNGGVGYTEPAKTVFFTEMTEGFAIVDTMENPFVSGRTYLVNIDGTEYVREAKIAVTKEGAEATVIGNPVMISGEANDDPFCVFWGEENGIGFVYAASMTYGTHITVSEAETVHTIDQKYLFPRVELTTKLYNDEFYPYKYDFYPVTAEDHAALEEARKCGIFYLSAHVTDPDTNPWHIGGIPTMKEYDDDSNAEYYEVLSNFEDIYISLQLMREDLDGVGTWLIASLTGVGLDGSYTNSGDDFPVPE